MNNYSEQLQGTYARLIRQTTNRLPENYKEIQLRPFLKFHFGIEPPFLSESEISTIKNQVKLRYGIDKDLYINNGSPRRIQINQLTYYQEYVEIDGPMHSFIDEPVEVLKWNGQLILINGYHRLLYNILSDKSELDAYILEVNTVPATTLELNKWYQIFPFNAHPFIGQYLWSDDSQSAVFADLNKSEHKLPINDEAVKFVLLSHVPKYLGYDYLLPLDWYRLAYPNEIPVKFRFLQFDIQSNIWIVDDCGGQRRQIDPIRTPKTIFPFGKSNPCEN